MPLRAPARNAAGPGSIEDIINRRRNSAPLPSKEELSARTAEIISSHNPSRKATPGVVYAEDEALASVSEADSMTFDGLNARCDEILEGNGSNVDSGNDYDVMQDVGVGGSNAGSLLDGPAFDEGESAASFAAALADFRGSDGGTKEKLPCLGDRLLAKGYLGRQV